MAILTRRNALAAVSALLLAACGSANGDDTTSSATGAVLGDFAVGPADAQVTVIEYASPTCPHCKTFHDEVVPVIKEYAVEGKVRFIFREFPTPPVPISVAGIAIARCSGESSQFDVLDDLFENQAGILSAARSGAAEDALKAVAARHGIDSAQFDACINDQDIRRAIADTVETGRQQGVGSTPTIFLNGVELRSAESRSADGMRALLDAQIEALGG